VDFEREAATAPAIVCGVRCYGLATISRQRTVGTADSTAVRVELQLANRRATLDKELLMLLRSLKPTMWGMWYEAIDRR
jgi:hypothetical protein